MADWDFCKKFNNKTKIDRDENSARTFSFYIKINIKTKLIPPPPQKKNEEENRMSLY
jgi:hypothetical protein